MSDIKPLALVTGASSGIGATFARRLASDGYGLILVARRSDRLEDLARELGGAETIAADLTDEEDLKTVEDRIDRAPELELLINNAGFGAAGRFHETPVEIHDRMHRLHVCATVRLSHAALRGMAARGKGAVINVASVAGFGQSPGSTSYSATKAWMISLTKASISICARPIPRSRCRRCAPVSRFRSFTTPWVWIASAFLPGSG